MRIIQELSQISRRNRSLHGKIVISLLYFEKIALWKFPVRIVRKLILECLYHVELNPDLCISRQGLISLRLPHPYNIIVNENAHLGEHCTIFHNVTLGAVEEKGQMSPNLGNNVYVGCYVTILGGVEIRDNVKIGAMSLVLRDVKVGTVHGLVK